MIELVRDPSGEVQLASAPSTISGETEMTSMYMSYDNNAQSQDEKTIAELKETIQSLHSQIEVSMESFEGYSCYDIVGPLIIVRRCGVGKGPIGLMGMFM